MTGHTKYNPSNPSEDTPRQNDVSQHLYWLINLGRKAPASESHDVDTSLYGQFSHCLAVWIAVKHFRDLRQLLRNGPSGDRPTAPAQPHAM
ncbi:hypothetical protein CY34DRAFT_810643 [Suillus luteus UH-Slu-Lm8-n1]|uniref:Uncharacterized protein n=1 Tax=Suillus luteus UH-Slu-Lm8-n1 TaxID=930992 RepID=A0A0D0AG80_9AGAM|nr:hypothetical protein CY34DRAFT_810643 [Suillus luteus UH-Slu-Lm8-n1]